MADEQSRIRFKRGPVEFELVGSAADVSKAWGTLAAVVTDAFKGPDPEAEASTSEPQNDGGGGKKTTRKRTARKSTPKRGGHKPDQRDDLLKTLMGAELEGFADVADATARYQGYALLRWAKDRHGVDGLTASEIQTFFRKRFGVPSTAQAYREGFSGRGREVVGAGRPAVYELFKPGRDALETYLKEVEAGASPDAAAAAAEEETEQS